jgi:hypothetical protein
MTIAQTIIAACDGADAYTLHGGYATSHGPTVCFFPTGHCEQERKNDKGRTTYARYHYADGSRLEYRYSNEQATLKELT